MNTTKNEKRMEKLRKARSPNDVISVIGEITKDIRKHKGTVGRMSATAAELPKSKSVRIGMTGVGPQVKLKAIPTGSKQEQRDKDGNRAKFAKRPLGSGIKPENYHAPSIESAEKMQNKVDVIHDLHENLIELDAAREKMRQQFRGAKNLKVALAGIQALQDELQETMAKAYDMLETIAQKHIPEELETMNEILVEFMQDHIPETKYEDMRSEVYVTMRSADKIDQGKVSRGPKKIKIDVKNADFAFHCYTIIDKLKNSDGYEFEEYCIVLTGLVDRTGTLHYFLNALPDFKSPGKFNIGQEVEDEHAMNTRLSLLLAHNDLVTEMERKPMPLTTKTAKEKGFHSIEGVDGVHVVDDTLRITVTRGQATPTKLEEIKMEVRDLLSAVIGRRSKSKVLPRKVKAANGQIVLVFSLIPDIPDTDERRDYSVNVSKLHDLQKALGLPDSVVKEVKKAMLSHT